MTKSSSITQVVNALLADVVNGCAATSELSWPATSFNMKLLKTPYLLCVLGELAGSYAGIANIIANYTHGGEPLLSLLVHRFARVAPPKVCFFMSILHSVFPQNRSHRKMSAHAASNAKHCWSASLF